MKELWICEKRSAAEELIRSGCFGQKSTFTRNDGFYENDKVIFTWCAGHLYRAKMPQEINPEYTIAWNYRPHFNYMMDDLLTKFENIPYDEPQYPKDTFYKQAKKQIKTIQILLKRKDYDKIIFAADPDAEGESIHTEPVRQNKKLLRKGIQYYRFWNTGSYEDAKAVQQAYQNLELKGHDKFTRLLSSQKARRVNDFYFGMTLSTLFSDLSHSKFRIGRVVSAILGVIGRREDSIQQFVAKDFWVLKAHYDNAILTHYFMAKDFDVSGDEITVKKSRYEQKDDIEQVINDCQSLNLMAKVVKNSKRLTSSSKPLPYSTDEFNVEFMREYKVDLEVSNGCLEFLQERNFISYERTNGNYFFSSFLDSNDPNSFTLNKSIEICKQYFAQELKQHNLKVQPIDKKNPIINDKKAELQNHTPLHITKLADEKDIQLFLSNPYHNERKINLKHVKDAYEMIATRCLIHALPDDVIQKENLTVQCQNHLFETNAEKVLDMAWKKLDKWAAKRIKKSNEFSFQRDLQEGDEIQLTEPFLETGKTSPPPRFKKETLLAAILLINDTLKEEFMAITDYQIKKQKMAQYKSIVKLLKNVNGLGTDATRETILEKLFLDKDVIEDKKKELHLTASGRMKYEILPDECKSIELTAIFEQYLNDIRNGLRTEKDLQDFVYNLIKQVVNQAVSQVNHPLFKHKGQTMFSSKQIAILTNPQNSDKLTPEAQTILANKIDDFDEDEMQILRASLDRIFCSFSPNQTKNLIKYKDKLNAKAQDLIEKHYIDGEDCLILPNKPDFETVKKALDDLFASFASSKNSNYNYNGQKPLSEKQMAVLRKNSAKLAPDIQQLLSDKDDAEFTIEERQQLYQALQDFFNSFNK